MLRRHVVVVSGDPAFLDAARVLLQAGRYNVTTTNLLPRSYELIEAAGAAVLVVDLTIEEPAVWALVERLGAGERTRHLPIVFTATAPALLERADRQAWPAGGRFVFVKPFRPAACPPARRRAYPVGAARSSGAASRCFDAPG